MRRALPLLLLAGVGCFDFREDARFCQEQGRCRDGGAQGPVLDVPTVACSDGFCWENPLPHGWHVYAVASPRSGEVWAVGEATAVTRFQDGGWTVDRPRDPSWAADSNPAMRSIVEAPSGLVVVLDDQNTFRMRRADGGWSQHPAPPCVYPDALAANASGIYLGGRCDFPVTGVGGWLGRLENPSTFSWTGVWGDGGDGVALKQLAADGTDGLWATGVARLVQVGNGAVTLAEPLPFTPVDTVAPQPGGGVLVAGAGFCAIRSADGGWAPVTGTVDYRAAANLGGRTLMASAEGVVWSCVPGTCSGCIERGRAGAALSSMASNGEEAFAGGQSGTLLRVAQDGTVTELSSGSRTALSDVWVGPGGEGWAVGEAGALLHRTAQGWQVVDTGLTVPLLGVVALAPGQLAMAGSALLGTWSGAGFQAGTVQDVDGSPSTLALPLRALVSAGPEATWAVGHGQVLRYLPADGVWRREFPLESAAMQWSAGWSPGAGTIWVGAGAGLLRRVTAEGTTDEVVSGCTEVTGLWGVLAEEPFVVCRNGLVVRRTGPGTFEALPSPGAIGALLSISGSSAEDLWVAGSGVVARYARPQAGASLRWQVHHLRAQQALLRKVLVSAGSVWVVGDRGLVMRRPLP